MEHRKISLITKPGASLHVSTFFPEPSKQQAGEPLEKVLVVFLNGLVLPRSGWSEVIEHLIIKARKDANLPLPALLSYDRFGQGDSDPDPSDPPDTAYGHNAQTVVADLHQLLTQVSQDYLDASSPEDLSLVLVCNSIGCALTRLYAASHPGSVSAMLFLDSMMANSDFISLFPDPDDADFDAGNLPRDVSVEDIRHAREQFSRYFHPSVPNSEKFDRRNLAELLPRADAPLLPRGPGGRWPRLVVVGHDPDEFARQCNESSLSVPKPVINAYVNPAWVDYNVGLSRLVPDSGPVKIAKGCGHFIQKDDPHYVATEINRLLDTFADNR